MRPVSGEITLRTERLLLRPWRAEDREPFAALNADPRVMEWFPAPMTAVESNALWIGSRRNFARRAGVSGRWRSPEPIRSSVSLVSVRRIPPSDTRLSRSGGASPHRSGATAMPPRPRSKPCVSGSTTCTSMRSSPLRPSAMRSRRRVMTKIGMEHNPEDDFDHPRLREVFGVCRATFSIGSAAQRSPHARASMSADRVRLTASRAAPNMTGSFCQSRKGAPPGDQQRSASEPGSHPVEGSSPHVGSRTLSI